MLKCRDLLIERMCHIFLHTYKIAYLSLMYFQTVFLFGKPKLLPGHFSIMFFSFLWKKFHLFYMFWLMVNYLRYNQIIGSISWFPPICILTAFNISGRAIHSEAALAAKKHSDCSWQVQYWTPKKSNQAGIFPEGYKV